MMEWVPRKPNQFEIKIKRSRFIGLLYFVEPGGDPRGVQAEIESLYPRANHYCWGYRIQWPSVDEASSDAGEPGGTAGRPILQALQRNKCIQASLFVVRYFGGVKLGVRGLIDAYGETAEETVTSCPKSAPVWCTRVTGLVPYGYIDMFHHWWNREGVPDGLLDITYGENISMDCWLPDSYAASFEAFRSNWSSKGENWVNITDQRTLRRIDIP